jgi:hypothetical protein
MQAQGGFQTQPRPGLHPAVKIFREYKTCPCPLGFHKPSFHTHSHQAVECNPCALPIERPAEGSLPWFPPETDPLPALPTPQAFIPQISTFVLFLFFLKIKKQNHIKEYRHA